MMLDPALLILDPSLKARHALDPETINEYAEAFQAGTTFPPIKVVDVENRLLVVDGWHRVHAALRAGVKLIPVDVGFGSWQDAVAAAAGANRHHGLRRTRADKRVAVGLLLTDPQLKLLSGRDLAALAGVSHTFVDLCRRVGVGQEQEGAAQAGQEPQDASAGLEQGSAPGQLPPDSSYPDFPSTPTTMSLAKAAQIKAVVRCAVAVLRGATVRDLLKLERVTRDAALRAPGVDPEDIRALWPEGQTP